MTEHRPRLPRVLALTLALGALYGCSGGLSCGGNSGGCLSAYPFPQTTQQVPNGAEYVDDGIRMRMTQNALDFLSANIRPLLAGALGANPGDPIIRISNTDGFDIGGGVSIGRGNPEVHPTEIFIDGEVLANSMELEFVGEDGGQDGIRLRVTDVPVGLEARVFHDFGAGDAACDIFGTNDNIHGGRPWLTTLTLEAIIKPRVGSGGECDNNAPECLKIDVEVVEAAIGGFGTFDIELDSPPLTGCNDGLGECSEDCSDTPVPVIDPNGDLECDGECVIGDIFVDIAAGLAGLLNDLIGGFLPGLLETAVANALDDFDGSPIAVAGRLNLAGFAPGILPSSALDLGYSVGPLSGEERVRTFDVNAPDPTQGAKGMDLIFKSGFEAAPSLIDDTPVPHPCVRHIEGNDFAELYGDFQFQAPNADPLTGVHNGNVYHLGASMAAGALNQALFAAYNSGALCIEATSESIYQLTDGAFPLSAGTIDVLTGGKLRQYTSGDAPAVIALAPSQPPVLAYGAGDDVEGHMKISWPKVEVSFYVLINERFSRVFAVATDVSLQLTVFSDPDTSTLRLAVVDGPNIENFTENYNELLPGVAFTEVLESLIGVAFDAALGNGLEFPFDVGPILSDALGAPIYVDRVEIETTPADNRQFLNVYIALTNTPPPQPHTARAQNVRVAPSTGLFLELEGEESRYSQKPSGEVRLEADDAIPGGGEEHEFFARVDFGMWRGPFRPGADGVVVVRDPKLRLVGEHTVTLRARIVGEPKTLEPEGESIQVWVDPSPPRVQIAQAGQQVVASGWDVGSRAEDLRWQWQLDDGEWSAPGTDSVRPLAELFGRRVAARAIDPAGNVSKSAGLDLSVARKRAEEAARLEGGCAQSDADGVWLAACVLAGVAATRRRRR